jgi:hypothetical protein
MPRRSQTANRDTAEDSRPPWPDQVTESQYERGENPPADELSETRATLNALTERASALAGTAVGRARQATNELASFTQRRPLSAILGAVVFGLALGLIRRRPRS